MSEAVIHTDETAALLSEGNLYRVEVAVPYGIDVVTEKLLVTASTEHQARQKALSYVSRVERVSRRDRDALIRDALRKSQQSQ